MGFTTGFTGGVTLTLSLAYLTVLAHQRNRERQSAILRANNYIVSGITDPLPPVYQPSRSEVAAQERENFLETAKDKWNAELEKEVRWVQNTDWNEVREGVETAVGRLWARALGRSIDDVEKGEEKAAQAFAAAREDLKRETKLAADKANAVVSEKAGSVTDAAKSAYADAKARGAEAASKTQAEAQEAKGSIFNAVGRGIEKGKEALGIAHQKLVGAEEVLEGKIDEKLSPVERTLKQRYEKPSGINQSVEETLAERLFSSARRKHKINHSRHRTPSPSSERHDLTPERKHGHSRRRERDSRALRPADKLKLRQRSPSSTNIHSRTNETTSTPSDYGTQSLDLSNIIPRDKRDRKGRRIHDRVLVWAYRNANDCTTDEAVKALVLEGQIEPPPAPSDKIEWSATNNIWAQTEKRKGVRATVRPGRVSKQKTPVQPASSPCRKGKSTRRRQRALMATSPNHYSNHGLDQTDAKDIEDTPRYGASLVPDPPPPLGPPSKKTSSAIRRRFASSDQAISRALQSPFAENGFISRPTSPLAWGDMTRTKFSSAWHQNQQTKVMDSLEYLETSVSVEGTVKKAPSKPSMGVQQDEPKSKS
ncbi:putative MICOS complex subunit MIC12 [Seiridium unicorne]|uniref:MICOS complex subunit MIC12 n=1 Tax=Seiridium unicorne TaxID=138068 RepID=A0ABR2UE78_9PEZI